MVSERHCTYRCHADFLASRRTTGRGRVADLLAARELAPRGHHVVDLLAALLCIGVVVDLLAPRRRHKRMQWLVCHRHGSLECVA